MSHTPGPWRVERRFSNRCEIVPSIVCEPSSDRGCGWIADAVGAPYLGYKSTLPNAYLIAAAPDLLAACEAALSDLSARDAVHYHGDTTVTSRLRSAIAKATGSNLEGAAE